MEQTQTPAKTLDQVSKDVLGLSSGTIAGLIGNTSYAVIDKVQAEFFQFTLENAGEFPNWVKAWYAFDLARAQAQDDGTCRKCHKLAMYRMNGLCEECI